MSQEVHRGIIQKQLQMNMTKKCLKMYINIYIYIYILCSDIYFRLSPQAVC